MISHFNSGQSGSYVILISLLTNYADHLFTCLSVVHIPYEVKYMFRYVFIIALVSMQCCPGSRCYRMRTLFLFLFFCFRHLFIQPFSQLELNEYLPSFKLWEYDEAWNSVSAQAACIKSCQLRFSVIIMYSCLLLCSLWFTYMDDFHKVKR